VRFAAGTGAVVCAEGVETLEDLRVVASLDVGYAQGWVIARPGDAWKTVAAEASAAVADTADGGLRPISGLAGLGDQVHEVRRLVAAGDAAGAAAIVAGACRADHVVVQAASDVTGPARRRVLETGLPGQVLAHDPLADPGEVARLAELGCRSLLLVPIVEDGRAVGVLEAARREETAWTRIDAEQAETLARQLRALLEATVGS
jgi:GAF domain-containing protein